MSKNLGLLLVILAVIGVFLLFFGVNWLLTKGIIWVMFELFKIDWRGKFWVVFIALIIFHTILKSIFTVTK